MDGNWATLATAGTGVGQADAAGNVYVADTWNNRIQRRDVNGTWTVLASFGRGARQVNRPFGLALDAGGNLFVADWLNSRIQRRDAGGGWTVLATSGRAAGQVDALWGVAVDRAGNLYTAEQGSRRVQQRSPALTFTPSNWNMPQTVTLAAALAAAGGDSAVFRAWAANWTPADVTATVESADLTVTAVMPSTPIPLPGATFSVAATVLNRGAAATAGSFTVGLYLERATAPATTDTPDATQTITGLAAGAGQTVTFTGLSYATQGARKLVVAWGSNSFGERNAPVAGHLAVGVAAGVFHSLALVPVLSVGLTASPLSPQAVGTSVNPVANELGASGVQYQLQMAARRGPWCGTGARATQHRGSPAWQPATRCT